MTLGLVGFCATAAEAATEAELQSAVFRAKPAVVMIGVQVGATATVHCGAGAPVCPCVPGRRDCQIKHNEQGYLHREEVQLGVLGASLLGAIAALWFGGQRLARARRASLRRMIQDELREAGVLRP